MNERQLLDQVIAMISEPAEGTPPIDLASNPEAWLDRPFVDDGRRWPDDERLYALVNWDRTLGEFRALFIPQSDPARRPRVVHEHRPGLLGLVLVALTAAAIGFIFGAVLTARSATSEALRQPAIAGAVPAAPSLVPEAPPLGSGGVSPSAPAAEIGRPSPAAPPDSIPASAIETGVASWCAPTPKRCQSWGGKVRLGAVSSFRWGDRPYPARVCRQSDESRCVVVTVVSYCGCPGPRVIDLSPYAFSRLGPLPRGVLPVVVTFGWAGSTPPPTDIEP